MSHNPFNGYPVPSSSSSSSNTNSNNSQLENKTIQEQLSNLRQLLQESEQRIMRRIDLVRDETQRNFRTMRNNLDQIQINELNNEILGPRIEQTPPTPIICTPQIPSINMPETTDDLMLALASMNDFNIFEMQITDPHIRYEWVKFKKNCLFYFYISIYFCEILIPETKT